MDIVLKLATNLRPSGRPPSPLAPQPGARNARPDPRSLGITLPGNDARPIPASRAARPGVANSGPCPWRWGYGPMAATARCRDASSRRGADHERFDHLWRRRF